MIGVMRQATYRGLAEVRRDPAVLAAAHAAIELPPSVVQWLTRLALLGDVPLAYLAADPALLPLESIRFFHLDRDWLTALIEGACSIGRASSSDAQDDAQLVGRLRDAALAEVPDATGFVLRSAVLDGWPGLEVSAYATGDVLLTGVLRHELIAPGVMLFVVTGVIVRIELHEPGEGLHFGVAQDPTEKFLRTNDGTAMDTARPATVRYRDGGTRAMRVADLGQTIKATSSASFALQLVQGVQSWTFDIQ